MRDHAIDAAQVMQLTSADTICDRVCGAGGFLVREPRLSLDLFWIKSESLTDPDQLPAPSLIAAGIVEDLEAALAQFTKVAARLAPAAAADAREPAGA